MGALPSLMDEVDVVIARGAGRDHAATLARITDLLVAGSGGFRREQIALFDGVIGRFAAVIETGARVELAERLARLRNGPPDILRALAFDEEIRVARPVLVRSAQLDDQILMEVASRRGPEHQLAICERTRISEMVTDILVEAGGGRVRTAVARNPGARLSALGAATLVEHSQADDDLQELLGERTDLRAGDAKRLVAIARETARRRLIESLPAGGSAEIARAIDTGVRAVESALRGEVRDLSAAIASLETRLAGRPPSQADLVALSAEGLVEETICAVARLADLSVATVEHVFRTRDNDLLLVIGRAKGWSWRSVRALLRLRDPALTERHHFHKAEQTFDAISAATAERVLSFLARRDPAIGRGAGRSGAAADQVRVNAR